MNKLENKQKPVTAKEKAIEIMAKFKFSHDIEGNKINTALHQQMKECALVYIDGVLEVTKRPKLRIAIVGTTHRPVKWIYNEYLVAVKNEIKKQ